LEGEEGEEGVGIRQRERNMILKPLLSFLPLCLIPTPSSPSSPSNSPPTYPISRFIKNPPALSRTYAKSVWGTVRNKERKKRRKKRKKRREKGKKRVPPSYMYAIPFSNAKTLHFAFQKIKEEERKKEKEHRHHVIDKTQTKSSTKSYQSKKGGSG